MEVTRIKKKEIHIYFILVIQIIHNSINSFHLQNVFHLFDSIKNCALAFTRFTDPNPHKSMTLP
jgi:hypothetical protein